jgi:hypothetical protein
MFFASIFFKRCFQLEIKFNVKIPNQQRSAMLLQNVTALHFVAFAQLAKAITLRSDNGKNVTRAITIHNDNTAPLCPE